MSRAKSTQPKSKDRTILEEIGTELLSHMMRLNSEKTLLVCEPMIMLPVKYSSGSFKNKATGANWEFFPEYVYIGASGNMIFGMSTPDQTEEPRWETAEFNPKKLDDAFPLLLPELATIYGEFGTDKATTMTDLIDLIYDRRVIKQAMEMESEEDKMRANPLFGLF